MNIVIDTNIFIAALIKDGKIREIITQSKDNLLFPYFEFEEIQNNKTEIIRKSCLSEREFNILFLRLLNYVKIVPSDIIINFREKAKQIMDNIDVDDSVFIATALAFDSCIWSDDKHFKMQESVRVLTTKEMMGRLG